MKKLWQSGVCVGLLLVLAVAMLVLQSGRQTVLGGTGTETQTGGTRYTVVATDGTHLVVTDNRESKVFFYAIDQGGKPGDELKFRGTINLEDVGKPIIKPTAPKK